MILKYWLKKNSKRPYTFANELGVAPATIYNSITHKRRLSARTALKVESETNGEVTRAEAVWPEDFIEVGTEGEVQFLSVPRMH